MDKKAIKRILESKGYRIVSESRAGNNYGDVLKLDNGCIVNCYDKGTINSQGKNCAEINLHSFFCCKFKYCNYAPYFTRSAAILSAISWLPRSTAVSTMLLILSRTVFISFLEVLLMVL